MVLVEEAVALAQTDFRREAVILRVVLLNQGVRQTLPVRLVLVVAGVVVPAVLVVVQQPTVKKHGSVILPAVLLNQGVHPTLPVHLPVAVMPG